MTVLSNTINSSIPIVSEQQHEPLTLSSPWAAIAVSIGAIGCPLLIIFLCCYAVRSFNKPIATQLGIRQEVDAYVSTDVFDDSSDEEIGIDTYTVRSATK